MNNTQYVTMHKIRKNKYNMGYMKDKCERF